MKKVAVILCIVSLLSNVIANAAAVSMTYSTEQKIETLKQCNIVNGYEDGNFYPQNNISRAEFCKMVSVMSGMDVGNSMDNNSFFADVPTEHWANRYIMFCYNNGLIKGVLHNEKLYFVDLDENGNEIGRSELFYKDSIGKLYGTDTKVRESLFAPDDYITYQDALKILVCALGYEEAAKSRGDYPLGYVSTAKNIGIISTPFSNTDYISRESAAEMIYNTLFAPMMIKKTISDENGDRTEYIIADGINGNELHTLYKKYFEKE